MSDRERVQFVALSVVVIVSIVACAGMWIAAVRDGQAPRLSAGVGLLLLAGIGVWLARWFVLPRMRCPRCMPVPDGVRVAAVTTFVPTHEPVAMLERTLRAMLAMEGDHDTWLLDEGDDESTRALCARLGVQHFSRRGVVGYNTKDGTFRGASKHGNYNAWLDYIGYAGYDVIVAFDPDHVPRRRYLTRTLGYLADPRIAFVQPAQVYYNQDASFIAHGAAEESFAYYSSHLMASYGMGHAIVIGSHGVHRIRALADVGGFPAHDAEDLFLTLVYKAAGWRGVYVPEILALGCAPTSWHGYLKQQLRWSRSVLDLKLRVFPKLAAKLSLLDRLLNLLHGAFYLRALAVPAAYLFLAALLVTGLAPGFLSRQAIAATVLLGTTLALIDGFRQRYYLDPRREGGVPWRATIMQTAKWPVFAQAVWEAAHGRRPPYSITRKLDGAVPRWTLAPPNSELSHSSRPRGRSACGATACYRSHSTSSRCSRSRSRSA